MNYHDVVVFAQWAFLCYFVALTLGYLALNLLALGTLLGHMRESALDDLPRTHTGLETPVSILVPAYNEEASIVASVRSLLQLAYPEYEVVVINDGSKDGTLAALKAAFELEPYVESAPPRLATRPVRAGFRSRLHPNLRVFDKENGGKADALNVGINVARFPLFCGVDADSILQRDSLTRVVGPFDEDARTVATGGTVRVANGCTVEAGFLTGIGLPRSPLALFQIVEYLRAFLFGRLGWSPLNALLIISGAFGVFRREVVISVGGYRSDSIGEDMELVVRLHRELRARGDEYRIRFVPDPICWTEVPEDLATLRNQRIRWQRGLSESLMANRSLCCARGSGAVGWLAFPFMIAFEWLSPAIELAGYIFMVLAWALGAVSGEALFAFLFVAVMLGILLSVLALLLEELSFHLYPRGRQLLLLFGVAVAENLGYRQLNSWWRLIGLWRWATNARSHWGVMVRKGSLGR
jgi:cellulose synthase/poly-beta-1,6-N-acetylglucosamine synthase-like glycosyltransferase